VVEAVNSMLREGDALPQLVRHGEWGYHLHATSPDSPLADYRVVAGVLQNGAAGYLLVDQPMEDLVGAIRSACAGETVVAPSVVPALLARIGAPAGRRPVLTRRELEAPEVLAGGVSTAVLAVITARFSM